MATVEKSAFSEGKWGLKINRRIYENGGWKGLKMGCIFTQF